MEIGIQTHNSIVNMISKHLQENHAKIDEAYLNAGQDLTIAFGVKLSSGKNGCTDIAVSINCIRDRIKATKKISLDEKQQPLPFKGSGSV